MTSKPLTVHRCTCEYPKCRHKWITRTSKLPKVCPKCKRKDWNEKQRKRTRVHGDKAKEAQ